MNVRLHDSCIKVGECIIGEEEGEPVEGNPNCDYCNPTGFGTWKNLTEDELIDLLIFEYNYKKAKK